MAAPRKQPDRCTRFRRRAGYFVKCGRSSDRSAALSRSLAVCA
jgi:hypothetical protein